MNKKINGIKKAGTDAKMEIFEEVPHGLGLGEGTIAEDGFLILFNFWKKQMK